MIAVLCTDLRCLKQAVSVAKLNSFKYAVIGYDLMITRLHDSCKSPKCGFSRGKGNETPSKEKASSLVAREAFL